MNTSKDIYISQISIGFEKKILNKNPYVDNPFIFYISKGKTRSEKVKESHFTYTVKP